MTLRVLDLFAGLGGWSAAFRRHGHDVTTLDNDPRFGCDVTADILTVNPYDLGGVGYFDVILASPPCETFSTLAFQRGHYKMTGTKPNATYAAATPAGELALSLVHRTLWFVTMLEPRYYVIENPRALLRELMPVQVPRIQRPGSRPLEASVWYCHVGHTVGGRVVAKPTDLWGHVPATFTLPGPCHNQRTDHPADCCCRDHVSAPRGSRTGTQGPESAAERAKVPYGLSTRLLGGLVLASVLRRAVERERFR